MAAAAAGSSMPVSQFMLESIARMNNLGVGCLTEATTTTTTTTTNGSSGENSQRLVEAGLSLKGALEKANAMTFFCAHAGGGIRRHHHHHHHQDDNEEKSAEVSKNLYIYQRGEYDEGMHTYSSPIPLDASSAATSKLSMHQVTATILFNLGQLYLRLNEEQEATDAFLQALQLMHMGSSERLFHHHGSGMVNAAAVDSSNNNNNGSNSNGMDISKKEQQLQQQSHMAGACCGTIMYKTCGSTGLEAPATPTGALSSSDAAALAAADSAGSGTTLSLMALYHNLGHLQYRSGHYEDAVRTYSKALEVGRSIIHPTSHQLLELAATLNCLGVLCFHLPQADTEQAMALYQESLALRFAVLGKDAQTKEIATTLNNIGRVHYMKGAHAIALEWYQRALLMRRQLLGPDHLDVAAVRFLSCMG